MHSLLSFCQGLPQQRFEAEEILIVEGGTDRRLYVLIDGEVAVLKWQTLVNPQ
jgi:CRP-like cAMP-binding protein